MYCRKKEKNMTGFSKKFGIAILNYICYANHDPCYAVYDYKGKLTVLLVALV